MHGPTPSSNGYCVHTITPYSSSYYAHIHTQSQVSQSVGFACGGEQRVEEARKGKGPVNGRKLTEARHCVPVQAMERPGETQKDAGLGPALSRPMSSASSASAPSLPDPPPALALLRSSSSSSSLSIPSFLSLPYCGDLDAARKARDSPAVRLLTQYRDQQKSGSSSPLILSRNSSTGSPIRMQPMQATQAPPPPAASSLSSLTRRLLELGFSGSGSSSSSSSNSSSSGSSGNDAAATERETPAADHHHHHHHQQQQQQYYGKSTDSSSRVPVRFASGAGDAGSPGGANVEYHHHYHHNHNQPPPLAAPHFFFRQTSVEEAAAAGGVGVGGGGGSAGEEQQQHKCTSAACQQQHGHTHASAGSAGAASSSFHQHQQHYQQRIPCDGLAAAAAAAAGAGAGAPWQGDKEEGEEGGEGEAMIEDPILMMCIPASQAYKVDCRCAHAFSTETLYGCIKTALVDDLIPACPLANHPEPSQRCNYLLTQQEVEQVLNLHAPPSQLPAEERKLWRFRRGRLVDGGLGWASERVTEAFLRKGKIAAGCIECPNGRCSYWVEPTRPLEKQRVDCPKCLMAFCTLCKRPYHFRCSCDEVMTITKQWLEWQQHGREPYLTKMAKEDSSYQAALDVFHDRRAAHVQEVHTAEQNWGLLVADENYKASRCRRCPHCNRVIERIDGCDTMVCGQNAHGGNIQNGCGLAFDWNEALFYNADIGEKRSIIPFQEVPPSEIARVEHQIMDGTPVKCDICSAKITGPLAMCINCPSFSCCIRCQNKHTRGHVLRLYMDGGGDR